MFDMEKIIYKLLSTPEGVTSVEKAYEVRCPTSHTLLHLVSSPKCC